MALVLVPDDGLYVLWKLRDPGAAAGVARRARAVAQRLPAVGLQPDAARARPVARRSTAPAWLKEYGFVIAARPVHRVRLAAQGRARRLRARRARCCCSRALSGGFVGGMLLKGKSGWCSSICPLLPVQRLYGQTPYKLVANSHCTPCVGLHEVLLRLQPEGRLPGRPQRPGPVLGRLPQAVRGRVPGPRASRSSRCPRRAAARRSPSLYGQLALYLAASIAVFYALDSLLKVSTHTVTTLFARDRLLALLLVRRPPTPWPEPARRGPRAPPRSRSPPAGCVRTLRQGAGVPRPGRRGAAPRRPLGRSRSSTLAAGRSMASHRALSRRRAGGHASSPRASASSPSPGMTLLEAAEAGGLPIESGCRMGVCGADPVCVSGRDGAPVGDLRRRALDARPARLRRQHPHGVLRARRRAR